MARPKDANLELFITTYGAGIEDIRDLAATLTGQKEKKREQNKDHLVSHRPRTRYSEPCNKPNHTAKTKMQ